MSSYSSPEKGRPYKAKFVRLGETLVTTPPNDLSTWHTSLDYANGLLTDLRKAIVADGKNVDADAGNYGVFKDDTIFIGGRSSTLRLPSRPEARQKTVTVFQAKSPGFSVKLESE